jgi:hypothetical protein
MIQPNGKWYTNPGWFLFIMAACAMLSGIFGNWISQNKDVVNITNSVHALILDQKIQDNRINLSSERIAILESNYKTMNDTLLEVRKDVKEILSKKR